MNKRKKISDNPEADVLIASKRRCALCYGIDKDLQEKQGQIAHLDKNPNNNEIDNLCFLCFNHHNQYDSKTSVSKNYTSKEIKIYRDSLYSQISTDTLFNVKPKSGTGNQVSKDVQDLLVYCGKIKEFFCGYLSITEVNLKGRELLVGLKEKVLEFGYNDNLIQPLRDFENRAQIVFDILLNHEDSREVKKDLSFVFKLLKEVISV